MDFTDIIEYSEKLILKLLPGIIHELNSPIQFIHDNLEYIQNEIAQRKVDINEIKDAANDSITGNYTMNRIIKGLSIMSSDFYRPFQDFSANEALESALYVTRNVWKYRFILDFKDKENGISVWCSPFSLLIAICCLVIILTEELPSEVEIPEQQLLTAKILCDDENAFFQIEIEFGSLKAMSKEYKNSDLYKVTHYLVKDYSKGALVVNYEDTRITGIIKIPLKGNYETA